MLRTVTLDFYHEAFGFSAGHFTIFSATERERLHGHNYSVSASVTTRIQEPGITFNYVIFKQRLHALCERLDRYFLIPEKSPYLKITMKSNYYEVVFHQEKMIFLKKDCLLLPIENTTLEDLSCWFLEQLIADQKFLKDYSITALTIKVFNGPEQSASTVWQK